MAYIDLTPSKITPTGTLGKWSNSSNIIGDDNVYAVNASGNTSYLYSEFYTGNHSNSYLPENSVITGIQIFYSARVSGATSGLVEFNYYTKNTRTIVSSSTVSPVLTNTEISSSVGGSAMTLGFPIKWLDVNTYSNGRVVGNPWLGVAVRAPSSFTSPIWIDNLYLRIHYTSYNYLVGSRSKFYLDREDLGRDVYSTSLASSHISRKENSIQSISQVKSYDVNLLGDAIYNTEAAILASSGYVYALDLKKTYLFSITVSAFCSPILSATNAIIYGKIRHNNSTYSSSGNISTSIYKSVAPHVSGIILCHWTSAIGWIDRNGTKFPLYVSPQTTRFRKVKAGIDYVIGVTALSSSIGFTDDYDLYEGATNAFLGYKGALFYTDAISGKIFLKILAIGRES